MASLEENEEEPIIEITDCVEVIAWWIPAHRASAAEKKSDDEIWADLERLSAEISAHWPSGVSAVDAVRDAR
jgi:hypothetical protein